MTTTTMVTREPARFDTLHTLQRLGDGRYTVYALYWPADDPECERSEVAKGRAVLTNGHWLLVRTDDVASKFDRLAHKVPKQLNAKARHNPRQPWAVGFGGRRHPSFERALPESMDGYAPIETDGLVVETEVRSDRSKVKRVHVTSQEGVTTKFQADYLLPLLGCGYEVHVRSEHEPAWLVRDGERVGVVMPMRL